MVLGEAFIDELFLTHNELTSDLRHLLIHKCFYILHTVDDAFENAW